MPWFVNVFIGTNRNNIGMFRQQHVIVVVHYIAQLAIFAYRGVV